MTRHTLRTDLQRVSWRALLAALFWSRLSLASEIPAPEWVFDRAGRAPSDQAFIDWTVLADAPSGHWNADPRGQDFLVNPEPSSLAVWSTVLMGLIAAGYACHRRWREAPPGSDAEHSPELPRQDSNLEKQNQNLLCYHYTTG